MSCGKTPFPLRKLAFHGNSNRHRVVLNSAPEHITSFKVVLTHSFDKLEVRTLKKVGILKTAQNLLGSCGKTPFPLRKLAFHGNSNRHRVVLNSAPEHITSFKVVLTHSLDELEVGTLKNVGITLFNYLSNVLASS